MKPIWRNLTALVAGIFVSNVVNMGIIILSPSIIPPPDGVDMTTMEGIARALPLLSVQHFIMPFLAHALGTFFGALTAVMIATHNRKWGLVLAITGVSLLGGILASLVIPAPTWFTVTDLALAYIPMGLIAGKLAIRKQKKQAN